jgi:acetate kinase
MSTASALSPIAADEAEEDNGAVGASSRALLVLNAGSSSIKFSVYEVGERAAALAALYRGEVDGLGTRPRFVARDKAGTGLADEALSAGATHDDGLGAILAWIEARTSNTALIAAGHRVVHGGVRYASPVRVTPEVLRELEALVPLAPLHQPHNLEAIKTLAKRRPALPQVACFDTAFHTTQPAVAQAFALPRDLGEAGIKRYGFHGLSFEYIASVLPEHLGDGADGRVVVAHLGAGASMCAMRGRRSLATTMGLTALDGLPMGTRPGAIDPGVILHLMTERGMSVGDITELLYKKSGLLGLSALSSDVRDLLASDSPHAAWALDVFVYRVGRELGSLAAALGGLDALVFTAGIGEHAVPIRARVCRDAAWLGIQLDEDANQRGGPCITARGSRATAWVIRTDEELMIARHTLRAV